ncbi:hypothetical protein VTK73DRAFT_595 [Phialemonium thermophilum]|uniref:Uncharacterized protein n=1 Tax=Phialemonium thermophilum TaxID=223376 RepID=A0ABR3VUL1_9PEZI
MTTFSLFGLTDMSFAFSAELQGVQVIYIGFSLLLRGLSFRAASRYMMGEFCSQSESHKGRPLGSVYTGSYIPRFIFRSSTYRSSAPERGRLWTVSIWL